MNIKEELFRAYCVAAFRSSPFGFTCPAPEKNICFSLCDETQTSDVAHSLFIRSNFKLQEWMVGPELFAKSRMIKSHFNRCFSERCGGVSLIIDIDGYGEFNGLRLNHTIPPEIKFYDEIWHIVHTKIVNLELKIQEEANNYIYKLFRNDYFKPKE